MVAKVIYIKDEGSGEKEREREAVIGKGRSFSNRTEANQMRGQTSQS